MNIVFSRSISSDTQPKNGRVRPFIARSIVNAKVRAGKVRQADMRVGDPVLVRFTIGFQRNLSEESESGNLRDPLAGICGSLANNNIAFVTLESFEGQ